MARQRRICLKTVVDEKGRRCVESAVIRDMGGGDIYGQAEENLLENSGR